jgi:hypothetical protein
MFPAMQISNMASSLTEVLSQILSVVAVMLYGGLLGAGTGYSAVMLPQLQSNTSSIPTDVETGSWIGRCSYEML